MTSELALITRAVAHKVNTLTVQCNVSMSLFRDLTFLTSCVSCRAPLTWSWRRDEPFQTCLQDRGRESLAVICVCLQQDRRVLFLVLFSPVRCVKVKLVIRTSGRMWMLICVGPVSAPDTEITARFFGKHPTESQTPDCRQLFLKSFFSCRDAVVTRLTVNLSLWYLWDVHIAQLYKTFKYSCLKSALLCSVSLLVLLQHEAFGRTNL